MQKVKAGKRWSAVVKRLVMWLAFILQPYGGVLPRDGSERNAPLAITLILLALLLVVAGLLVLGACVWLSNLL